MSQVKISHGEYHGSPVSGVFDLVQGFKQGKRGGFITVVNNGHQTLINGGIKCRIKVENQSDIEYINMKDENIIVKHQDTITSETDDEAMDRIASRFSILDQMSQACINGDIRAMIVSGPPGVGKSFGVETQLEKSSLFDQLSGKKIRYEIVKGAMTSLGLYAQLYKYSDPKNVLVFDDCDSAFGDELSLNILKAALDSGKRRRIFWNSDSALLRREGVPDNFEFKGSVIFITNLNFQNVKSKKIADHLEALQSRCHYLDLTIRDDRDKMLRIKQVHRDVTKDKVGGLFADYNFSDDEPEKIFNFMWHNRKILREVSLRCALKIADLIKISPSNWENLAMSTICKTPI